MRVKRDKTDRVLGSLRRRPEKKTPIASNMFLPNSSGIEAFAKLKKIINWFCNTLFVDHIEEKTPGHNIVFDSDIELPDIGGSDVLTIHDKDGDMYFKLWGGDYAAFEIRSDNADIPGLLEMYDPSGGFYLYSGANAQVVADGNLELIPYGEWVKIWGDVWIDGNIYSAESPINILEAIKLKYEVAGTNYITFTVESDGDLTIDSNKTSYDLDFGDGNLITTGDITGEDLKAGGNMYVGNAEGDSYIYFYEGGSATGEYIKWDDSDDAFHISDSVQVDGLIIATNNISTTLDISCRNLIVSGTVDGIDIATDVAANTTHRLDNSQAHSDYMLNTGDTCTGDYNFASDNLFVDSFPNRIGIGTTSPQSKLHVLGNQGTGGGVARVESNTGQHCYFTLHQPTTAKQVGTLLYVGATLKWYAPDYVTGAGYMRYYGTVRAANYLLFYDSGPIVFNEDGKALLDVRMEGDTDANLFYLDAGTDKVGIGKVPTSKLEVAGAIASATASISASADDTDVSGINTLFVDVSAASVVLGGLSGGVAGQYLHIVITATGAAKILTIEDTEGAGTQDFKMHAGTDESITNELGGFMFVCDGSDWFDCSHAKHV